jgi:two-component system LytT family response regulator
MLSRILIVDDEDLARSRLKRLLAAVGTSAQILEASNGLEALAKIKSFAPDLIFLDIQMPGLTGFDVLNQVEERAFQLIFQTAYDEFAIQAFEETATDYLLKPFSQDRLAKALKKANELASQAQALSRLEANLKNTASKLGKIAVKTGNRTQIVDVADISYIMSRDHCTCLYRKGVLSNNELITELSLDWLEARLDSTEFIRCHRSVLVATSEITSLVAKGNQHELTLKSGKTVPVSRAKRRRLRDFFKP